VVLITATSGFYRVSEAISFPGNLQAYASGWVGLFICIGFPFLFLDHPIKFPSRSFPILTLNPRNIPAPSAARWNANRHPETDDEPWLLGTLFAKWFFVIAYLCFNLYIIVMPLIPPYKDGNGIDLEVKGWHYVTVISCVFGVSFLYYTLTIATAPVRSGGEHSELLQEAERDQELNLANGFSIMRSAGVHPEIFEERRHNAQYGYRRSVEVLVDSRDPSFLYWFFGGRQLYHWRSLGISDMLDWVLGRR